MKAIILAVLLAMATPAVAQCPVRSQTVGWIYTTIVTEQQNPAVVSALLDIRFSPMLADIYKYIAFAAALEGGTMTRQQFVNKIMDQACGE